MTSLAMRHRTRMLAEKASTGAASDPGSRTRPTPHATAYELQRAALGEDLRRLKDIQSIEAKIALKADLLPNYDDWVDGVIAAARGPDGNWLTGAGVQDDILVQTMIWAIDARDPERALPRAEYAIRYELALPSRFERTLGCLIAEEFAENALAILNLGEAIPDLDTLLQIEALTEDEDMPDEVRAKMHKAISFTMAKLADDEEAMAQGPAGGKRTVIDAALKHARRALSLNDKSGVKKEIERLEREARKLEPAPTE